MNKPTEQNGLFERIERQVLLLPIVPDNFQTVETLKTIEYICDEFEQRLAIDNAKLAQAQSIIAQKELALAAAKELLAEAERDAARYAWMKKWFAEGGSRAEIDPHCHIRLVTSEIIDAHIDERMKLTAPQQEQK